MTCCRWREGRWNCQSGEPLHEHATESETGRGLAVDSAVPVFLNRLIEMSRHKKWPITIMLFSNKQIWKFQTGVMVCWGWFCHLTSIGLTSSPYLMTGVPGKVMIRTRMALCSSHGTRPPTCEWCKHLWQCIQRIQDSQKLQFNPGCLILTFNVKMSFQ